jgi:hypothetical protein
MKKANRILIVINLLIYCQFTGQLMGQVQIGPDRNTLVLPVAIPVFLAGNFGEPRANHFHSGIDIKTNGTTGVQVLSVSDGYVSRIKVEPGGYGHALYIRHPNGYTSLYGHLLSFNNEINQYLIAEQYRREAFTVDLFPAPTQLIVKKGQLIALSGNSGGSEGPHLHFELRETQSENPVNPLVSSINIKDDIPPVISKVYVYSLKERQDWVKPVSASLIKNNGTYQTSGGVPLPIDEISGIGIETYDLLNGSDNHCGLYRIQGYLDGILFFESGLDEFSFAETRYVNSFMDYKMFISNRKSILKLFIDPNNLGTFYRFHENQGRIGIKDNGIHRIRIVVEDAAGNKSVADCGVRLDSGKFQRDTSFSPIYGAYFKYSEPNTFQSEGVEVDLPKGALYDDLYFVYTMSGTIAGNFSPIHQIHLAEVPVHLYYRLAIEATGLPEHLRPKAAIAQFTGSNRYSFLGGTWEGNQLVTRTRNFGSFCIRVDTIKPMILPLNFSSSSELKSLQNFRFTVKDDFSGIQSYRGEIDGKWILLEYDPKTFSLDYRFDASRIKTGVQHKLVIRVTDQLANNNMYTISFFR